jgi:hypothetical protein
MKLKDKTVNVGNSVWDSSARVKVDFLYVRIRLRESLIRHYNRFSWMSNTVYKKRKEVTK